MTELARRFDRLLAEAVADERERRRWHEHLHHGAAQPSAPQAAPPLLFRGHSGAGSTLEVLERADGTLDVVVDGVCVERLASAHELLTTQPGLSFRLGDVSFDERFAVSGSALAALQAMIESGGRPPYRYARELLLDGLVDRNFGLTRRGRRALRLDLLQGAARRGELAVPVHVTARGQVSERARHAAEEKLAKLARLAPRPVLFARATLVREADPALERPAIAKATMDVSGRIVRAHVAAPEMSEAIDLLVVRFGIAFCESSGPRLVRRAGNDPELVDLAVRNALAIGAGHSFIAFLREGYPVNVLNQLKQVPEVCQIFCATANRVEVVIGETQQGRGILGVVDGEVPVGVESEQDVTARTELLRTLGYKL
jgi:adenosine/AMP kinase